MSTITTLVGTDGITTGNSMTKINTNFSNLNTDKIETSVIDTDTSLAANSDSKIASQKAVKAYVDTLGNVNASETARGIVEEATDAEVTAGTATGGTGAKLFVTPAKLSTYKATWTYLGSVASGSLGKDVSSTSSDTIAHGLGKTPKLVRVSGKFAKATDYMSITDCTYSNSTQSSNHVIFNLEPTLSASSGNTFKLAASSSDYTSMTVTVDATNITLAWSKSGAPTGTATLIWDAIA